MQVPLFPLNTVLFPGGPLPLRIFEPRYLDMISACMKDDAPFGVLLIRDGAETGPATTWDVGTLRLPTGTRAAMASSASRLSGPTDSGCCRQSDNLTD